MTYDWSENLVKEAVLNSENYCEALRKLGVPVRGNNITTLKRKIKKYDIDTSHFSGRRYNVGPGHRDYVPAKEYIDGKRRIKSSSLRIKLVKEGVKEYKCDCCGISEWNGKAITLQLHHIDGNDMNNSLDNIQLLCPNCHSQTANYRNNKTRKARNYCIDCGVEISRGAKRCTKCSGNANRRLPISDDELISEYEQIRNSVALAKKYGVSEAAIRKHIGKLK